MADDINSLLKTREGERDWVRQIHDLVRAQQFDAAESRLVDVLSRQQRQPMAQAALALSPDRLSFGDWDRLNRFLAYPVGRLNQPAAAIGFDLSNFGDSDSGEPCTEVSLYCDRGEKSFPFSTATREEFLDASQKGQGPWQGSFDNETAVALHGFAPLNALLVGFRRNGTEAKRNTESYPFYVAASLWQGLRFHQLVASTLDTHGLSRRVPVLVAGHDEIYVASSVYFPERIVPQDTRSEAEVERERRRERRRDWSPPPEMIEAGLRRLLGGRRGPLVDLGVSFVAGVVAEKVRRRKHRRS